MLHWSAQLETGHTRIDAEHREFISRLESLRAAIDSEKGQMEIHRLIEVLHHYVLSHFSHEEAYMLRARCPGYEANCRAHHEFTVKFTHWLELLTLGHAPISVARDVHRESIAWIESHILKHDCQLRRCAPV